MLPTLEIFLFCQHNSTGGGNLELRQTMINIKIKLRIVQGVSKFANYKFRAL
jgi:hypothetical protein